MKKYTLKDLENSPCTMTKFFILQGKAKPEMIDEAYKFYITFSTHKRQRNSKNFTRRFLDSMNFYNSIKK